MEITKIYKPNEIDQAAKELQLGELIAFPTETVYGLGADAENEKAVQRVFMAKGRPADNPLNVTVCSVKMVEKYVGHINEWGQKLITAYWPGPLTLIFKIIPGSLPQVVTGGLETAAFRMPANQVTLDLIKKAGFAIVGPSANLSGKPSSTTAAHVLHDMDGKIAGVVDDGPTNMGVESTIIDLSGKRPKILRPGVVTQQQIEKTLGMKVLIALPQTSAQTKYHHYTPDAQVLMVRDNEWTKVFEWINSQNEPVGIMATHQVLKNAPNKSIKFDLGKDVITASHEFFAGIRELDNHYHVKWIIAQTFATEGLGETYMNRLEKASNGQYLL